MNDDVAEVHHLNRAPITEAAIDIRVRLSAGSTPEMLASLPTDAAARYSSREELRVFQGELQLLHGAMTHTGVVDKGVQGYRFFSPSRAAVVQFRLDGFTFSKLRPYSDWEQVLQEAKEFWTYYSSAVTVEAIHRIAVRTINNFTIPAGVGLRERLTEPPAAPSGMANASIRAALTRLVLLEDNSSVNSIVTKGLEGASGGGTSVVIDIDCYKADEFDVVSGSFWNDFQSLHDAKNRIFFGSLTRAAVREFE